MKFKYCPNCAGVDLKQLPNGTEECLRCHFIGVFREGAMNEINAYKKQLDSEKSPLQAEPKINLEKQVKDDKLQNRLESLKGRKTSDCEIW